MADGVVGGADGEGGASVWGHQIGIAGRASQAQHEGLLVQAVDGVAVRTVAVANWVLAALPGLAAASRGGHGRQAQEPILVQVLQQNDTEPEFILPEFISKQFSQNYKHN